MSFKCDKCNSSFKRQIDLNRHMNRKNPCYNILKCERCSKSFDKLYNYKRHINRKVLCDEIKYEIKYETKYETKQDKLENKIQDIKIMLEIEKERVKIKHNELLIEKEKTKQEKLKKVNSIVYNQKASRDINNITFNVNIANIESLQNHNMTIDEVRNNHSTDILKLVTNIFKHQYNSSDDDLKNNKCIKVINNSKYIVKTNDMAKEVNFMDIREIILNNFKKLVENTEDRFYPTKSRIEKSADFIAEEIINMYRNSVNFTHNLRNNGLVNKALNNAVS